MRFLREVWSLPWPVVVTSFAANCGSTTGRPPGISSAFRPEVADDIRDQVAPDASAFGSIRVEATVGSTRWRTSLFPDKARRTYLLPIKKDVRNTEDLETGDVVLVTLQI
jgi:Domain of unknown function (DUF1905)